MLFPGIGFTSASWMPYITQKGEKKPGEFRPGPAMPAPGSRRAQIASRLPAWSVPPRNPGGYARRHNRIDARTSFRHAFILVDTSPCTLIRRNPTGPSRLRKPLLIEGQVRIGGGE